ncbi:hypothetical protein ABKV19_026218, partial [Rosa sericea]
HPPIAFGLSGDLELALEAKKLQVQHGNNTVNAFSSSGGCILDLLHESNRCLGHDLPTYKLQARREQSFYMQSVLMQVLNFLEDKPLEW